MNRRPATAEEMTIGALVFKGNGKVQYRVAEIVKAYDGSTRYAVQKVATKGGLSSTQGVHTLRNFTIAN